MSKNINEEQSIQSKSNSYTCKYNHVHDYTNIKKFKIINKEYHSIEELKKDIEEE